MIHMLFYNVELKSKDGKNILKDEHDEYFKGRYTNIEFETIIETSNYIAATKYSNKDYIIKIITNYSSLSGSRERIHLMVAYNPNNLSKKISIENIENDILKRVNEFISDPNIFLNTFGEKLLKEELNISINFGHTETFARCNSKGDSSEIFGELVNMFTISNTSFYNTIKHTVLSKSEEIIYKTFLKEIESINKNKPYKYFKGIPCHYIIIRSNISTTNILMETLYQNQRILSPLYYYFDKSQVNLQSIFKTFDYNTIIFAIDGIIKNMEDTVQKNKGDVTPRDIKNYINKLLNYNMQGIFAVSSQADAEEILKIASEYPIMIKSLLPDNILKEEAMQYLNKRAIENGFDRFRDKLDENKLFSGANLEEIYLTWKNKYLQQKYGYTKPNIEDTSVYDPQGRLNKMVGLNNVKETVSKILSFFEMQKVYKERGIVVNTPCKHMIFTGNPGTAKTTIARVINDILYEKGVIKLGKIIEVGRAQLVGKYLGHTGPMVRAAIKEARGGILFIDEAYSLVDGRAGMYGDEAINTLVQEMDNVREDTIIIFAGYPDKMEGFLNTNPGLRSRIGFHVKFDNYSKDELIQILKNMAKEQNFKLSKDAIKIAEKEIARAINTKDFGNGRFVRSLLEQAIMSQSTRLVQTQSYVEMDDEEIFTIHPEDINNMSVSQENRAVGFKI